MSNILLKNLVDGPITPQMIVYVTQKATSVIPCDSMLSSLSSSSSSSTLSNSNSNHINNKSNNKNNNNNNKNNNNKNLNQSSSASSLSINTDNNHVHHIHHDEDLQLLPPLQNFIQRLVTRSSVSTATFLTTIIYLDRLKKKLPKLARGMHCTRHRVFLAILIVASKYLNDSSPRNKYWARFSSVYSVNKVNLMERQLLTLLDYDLRVTEAELLLHLSPFLKSPSSLSTSYNNNSTGNTLIDTLKLPYPINSNLNNNNNGNLDNHTINNNNEYIQRTCSYPQISIPKSLPLSMYDNDNNMNTINNNNNNVFSSPSSYQPLTVDNNNNYNYNDDNDDAMNTDEDDEFSSNTNNVNTVINDNSFSNFSQNIDQHQTKDQFGRRLSSTSTCSSSSTSSITTPTSVPTAFQNNSNNLLLQQQLNHLQLLQLQLNLFNKQPDIPSIPSIITPTSTNYLQSQHQLNQNSHNNHHHHHHYQQQSSFQPPPLKSLLSDAGADNYFGSSDFNNNNHNQIHHSHYNYNLPILNANNHNNNNNFHQHYNHIILPNPVNTTTTTNVSYME